MPVPSLVTDLSATIASNSPAGSDNVFPDLDGYLRSLSGFLASIRDNSGNGWVSPYLTAANPSYTGTLTGGTGVVNLGSGQLYKDASGNVGIGTATAVEKLTVWAGNAYVLRNGGAKLRLADQFNEVTFESVPVGSSSDAIFKTSALERMRLDQNGHLGLGVVPSAWGGGFKALQVSNGTLAGYASGSNVQVEVLSNAYQSSLGTYNYISTATASQYRQISGEHQWKTAPSGTAGAAITFTQAMTLDASGNLGVGGTPNYKLDVLDASSATIRARTTSSGNAALIASTAAGGASYLQLTNAAGDHFIYGGLGGTQNISFSVAGSERARIDSSGNLLVGTSTTITSDCKLQAKNSTAAQYVGYLWNATTTGDAQFVGFATEGTATSRGAIDYNRAGGLVRYNTTSDYRAKDIIGPVQDPGATIDALKVYEGVMKGATQSRPMLIAHEAQEHAPYAVSGVKDEVNEDGSPKYQQIDVSSLVPLLLAEIQSLRARVAALEA